MTGRGWLEGYVISSRREIGKQRSNPHSAFLGSRLACLALSLVCSLTQHSCKQTRLEMNDRFPFKIEHERNKTIFFLCHCGQMEVPA